MANKTNIFAKQAQALKQRMVTWPVKIGDIAVLFAKQRFREQAWVSNYTEPWRPRKNNSKGFGRALLVKSGRLRRSIRIIRHTNHSVTIGSDVPYAAAHNDGVNANVTVKAHTRNKWKAKQVETNKLTKSGKPRMKTVYEVDGQIKVRSHNRHMRLPRRRYIGYSPYLDKQIKRFLMAEIIKVKNSIQ